MPLTPLEIHNKEFRKTLRGYSEDEVDEFLDEVVRDFEALIRENAQLKDELGQARSRLEQYQAIETTLQSTLVVAQQSADELKAAARKEADLIVQEARAEAERLVEAARAQAAKIANETEEAKRQLTLFKGRIRGMLMSQLELLNAELSAAGADTGDASYPLGVEESGGVDDQSA